ncbi:hypothetical protein PGT21_023861 [Puccinia graminis f. sp. tritici]|uniref:Uncharacterized protein n=1 Tax=Puccinia graminis f. sp. tritici TaxID=56615 RepID=A0A5B0P0J2_PUCGR|nr:hypothetical protein PGT21_023861 [Puccinia graminis f. sp. tritici]
MKVQKERLPTNSLLNKTKKTSSIYADERCHMTARESAQSGTPQEFQNLLVPTKDGKWSDLLQTTEQQSNKPLT